jgi:hypothetical protein
MLKQGAGDGKQSGRDGFKGSATFDETNAKRLRMVLATGFGPGTSYNRSRDRHYVNLNEGVTETALMAFCQNELKGSPIPDNGDALLPLFQKAQSAGLVNLEFIKADAFLPEMGRVMG